MTNEQRILLEFFKTVRALSKNEGGKELFVASHIAQLLKKFPYASQVKSEIVDGEVRILKADEKIFDIVGYTPEELKGKPLSFIMFGELDPIKQARIIQELNAYGVSVKTNKNKHKNGKEVDTFGWIFKVGDNDYIEVVMEAKNVVGYDVGRG